jgi:hypothetical protein
MTEAQAATGGSAYRAKILARLKALLAMTTENSCTESEAMVAAEKASALMEEYDLSSSTPRR